MCGCEGEEVGPAGGVLHPIAPQWCHVSGLRNAAIWYAKDGYDPKSKGINGRRVAGNSFLQGFLRHAAVEEFVFLAKFPSELDLVRELHTQLRPDLPLRAVGLQRPAAMDPLTTLFYPSPNFDSECWRRGPYGQAAWSICGITHTTSTTAVMKGIFDLRMAPVAAWDAVICTSKAVQASVLHQMDLIDRHILAHLGAGPSVRPLFPVIPLGITCADFAPDAQAGAALRERIGAKPGDVVFTTIARLTPHEKFDPLPIYLALQAVQSQLTRQRLFVVFCGQFRDDHGRAVFTEGALRLMPDVGFHVLDGADPLERQAVLSGADVFLFLIDNIQETFGLAPIEAMAAGLPLLVSDWDGMKDTVTPDCGFRITTRSLSADHLVPEALRYQGGIDTYVQYCDANSALVELDQPELRARLLQLVQDPELRRKMGRAGQARAQSLYDWRVIIPQMQELWDEQDSLRRAGQSRALRYPADGLPVAPSPTALFAAYPTLQTRFSTDRFTKADTATPERLSEVLGLRNYLALKRMFADPGQIAAVLAAVGDGHQTAEAIAQVLPLARPTVDRILIWLLKYALIGRVTL